MKGMWAIIGICTVATVTGPAVAGHYTARGDYISSSKETMGQIGDWMQFNGTCHSGIVCPAFFKRRFNRG